MKLRGLASKATVQKVYIRMITELSLKNFRGFENHKLELRPATIIVGKNNAGKSTIVEALRLVAIISDRYKSLSYREVPRWLDIAKIMKGVRPSLKGYEINFKSMFHRYNDPPAEIKATFSDGRSLFIYLGPDEQIHAVIIDQKGRPITSKSMARSVNLPIVGILPQIGPLAREEKILTEEYVRRARGSSLSSIHFRNQLRIMHRYFDSFKELAESSWSRLQIRSFDGFEDDRLEGMLGETLSLLVRDGDFVSEVGWMGHGLQMWLQIMWFLAYSSDSATIILDEPDVYMHADLQRKLIRLLLRDSKQIIVATHSIEIMSEVDASNILMVDRYSCTVLLR